ncbi:WD repeat and FYVE domain-containing protein [Acrasis kona]|uniref:WD repeat and FYVE domain-containing protein n=1 Tax=Acrasis kona TaxID=1008807 RepID=A0AAW2ZG53_9EUKA
MTETQQSYNGVQKKFDGYDYTIDVEEDETWVESVEYAVNDTVDVIIKAFGGFLKGGQTEVKNDKRKQVPKAMVAIHAKAREAMLEQQEGVKEQFQPEHTNGDDSKAKEQNEHKEPRRKSPETPKASEDDHDERDRQIQNKEKDPEQQFQTDFMQEQKQQIPGSKRSTNSGKDKDAYAKAKEAFFKK